MLEAEIKAAMPLQRVRDGESRAGNKPPNGPRRAQSKAIGRVFCDVWAYVSCREYDRIPQSARETVKQGGTAKKQFVPDRRNSVRDFAFSMKNER